MAEAKASARRGPRPTPAAQRVLARLTISDTGYGTPCWLFQGTVTSAGYGNVGSRRGDTSYFESAHRVVYTAAHGAIPKGLQIDHLCNRRTCVNPAHLEAVTPYENNRREQLRRSGQPASWLQAGMAHIFGADQPQATAASRAMRRGG